MTISTQRFLFLALFLCLSATFFFGCGKEEEKTLREGKAVRQPSVVGKKVLVINSYHTGYAWSDDIEAGVLKVFDRHPEIELKFHRMDTKRNASEEFKKTAGIKAKDLIESWKPDVVIASDGSASKYVIVPYYKDVDLPFVFCGVNWDAKPFGFPFKNVTGMVEVAFIDELFRTLRPYAKGDRVGFLAPERGSTRKDLYFYEKFSRIKFSEKTFVKDFSEWKTAYLNLQKSVDILFVLPWQGIKDWDEDGAVNFVLKHTEIPSGIMLELMAKYVLACFAKYGSEQGEWAANTALEILMGKNPGEIPVTTNKKAKVILNMKLAKKLGVKFPMELIERASFVEEGGFR